MELHIVLPENRYLYKNELKQQHALRKQIFIEEHKWSGLRATGDLEYDQFDTPTALYVLALEDELGVVGGLRFHATVEPTLLTSVFTQGNERPVETGADVYEWTRFFIVKERREPKPCQVGGALQIAVLRYALANGGRLINMVTYAWYMPAMMKSGLKLKALGLPYDHEDMTLVNCAGAINAGVIAEMNAFYGLGAWPIVSRGIGDLEAAIGHNRVAA